MAAPVIGYSAKLSKGGVATTLTTAACTLVSGKTYQINNSAQRVLDPATAVVVFDNAVDHTADVVDIDSLTGKVTFASTYTVTGPVTVSGKYIPRTAVAYVKKLKGNPKLATADVTDINSAGYVKRIPTLIDFDGSFEFFDILSNAGLELAITNRTLLFLEHDPDGTGAMVRRAWVVCTQEQQDQDPQQVNTSVVNVTMVDRSTGVLRAAVSVGPA